MNKLYIDTSGPELGLAIIAGTRRSLFCSPTHKDMAEQLFPTLEKLLLESNIELENLDEVYVTKGPGSYTGSRMGLALAKVLKVLKPALEVYTCTSLQALLAHVEEGAGFALIDARNCAFFASGDRLLAESCARMEFSDVVKKLQGGRRPVVYVSDEVAAEELKDYAPLAVSALDGMLEDPSIFKRVDDVDQIKPFYLKDQSRG